MLELELDLNLKLTIKCKIPNNWATLIIWETLFVERENTAYLRIKLNQLGGKR